MDNGLRRCDRSLRKRLILNRSSEHLDIPRSGQALQISLVPGGQVIENGYRIATADEGLGQMGADEACSSRDEISQSPLRRRGMTDIRAMRFSEPGRLEPSAQ